MSNKETKESELTRRCKIHPRLIKKCKAIECDTELGTKLKSTASAILDVDSPEEEFDPHKIYNHVIQIVPSKVRQIFTLGLLENSMMLMAIFRETLGMYGANTLAKRYIEDCGILDWNKIEPKHQTLVWLGWFYSVQPRQINLIWAEHSKTQTLKDDLLFLPLNNLILSCKIVQEEKTQTDTLITKI